MKSQKEKIYDQPSECFWPTPYDGNKYFSQLVFIRFFIIKRFFISVYPRIPITPITPKITFLPPFFHDAWPGIVLIFLFLRVSGKIGLFLIKMFLIKEKACNRPNV